MRRRRLAALSIVIALVAFGVVATAPRTLAAKPSQAPSASLTITRADDGKTIALRVGDLFLLSLGEDFNWTVAVSDTSTVRRIPEVLPVRGDQGVYEAARVGEADVTATGVVNCALNQACPQLAALFRVHISVSTALPYRVTFWQLAKDGPGAGQFVVMGTVLAGPTCPVERIPPDPRCADRKVSGAEIIFVNDAGALVGDVLSDVNGRFSIVLPTGKYTLKPQRVPGLLGTAPPQVILVSDADVELTVRYDTGIR